MACIRFKSGGVVCATLPSELADPTKPPEGYAGFFDWIEHWRRRPHPFQGDPGKDEAYARLCRGGKVVPRCWTCGRTRSHKLHGEGKR